MTEQAIEPDGWVLYSAEPTRNRACGGCQACCTAIPVELSLHVTKPAGTRCPHQCSRGCAIYAERPEPCRYWSCRWLFDPAAGDLKRPDKGGYIVDCSTETILIDRKPFSALQVWIDPGRREAAQDPALRAYIAAIAERFGYPTILRFSQSEGLVLFAPSLTGDGWQETPQQPISHETFNARMAEAGVDPANRFLPR